MELNVVTGIETKIFYSIIAFLRNSGWCLVAEYDKKIFDKGVDFDLYQFSKNSESILLAWDNWEEGEIKASPKILNEIAIHFELSLQFGKLGYLNDTNIIETMKDALDFK